MKDMESYTFENLEDVNKVIASSDVSTTALLAETKFYEGYSRWNEDKERYETWEESVERVMNMHRAYYKDVMTDELESYIAEAEKLYKKKYALGAQRALQFGGDQLLKHQMRMYNCTSSYADRPAFFGELFYILLCGAGAGFSVQFHHINKLPKIQERKGDIKQHIVEDSIEGWATALDVLLSSYFVGGVYPEYESKKVYFDLSKVRPKGAEISGGFKAPGSEPLRKSLDKIELMLQNIVENGGEVLRPIHVYDICMHAADAVLAGGVRRSATICLFSPDDEEMLNAKTGNWFVKHPQRARSNNSAVIVRDQITRDQFANIMKSIRQFGEPGFYFVSSKDHTTNPCVEIGMFPQNEGKSGWQGCNLTEINGSKCVNEEEFMKACRAAAIMGTLQAGYTDFKFLSETSRKIFEREALLGVSITGWMNNPDVLLDADMQRRGAEHVKEVNAQLAELLGINPAARTTCVKPSGNASVLLQTASGIHAEHSPRYFRYIQLNKETEVAQLLKKTNPYMVEESVWSENQTDYAVAFPIISKEGSFYKDELVGRDFLEKVALVQQNWVEAGTNKDRCVDPTVRHNVSNTVTVPNNGWADVEEYVFENRYSFAGVSFLSDFGDKDFHQAPNTRILTEDEIVKEYGRGAMFASGLIVDTSKGFENLWIATFVAQQDEEEGGESSDLQRDWLRRFHKFADNYFGGDRKKAEYCLKDIYLLHKWTKIQQNYSNIEFSSQLETKKFTDIDTMGAIACQGGACEITF